MHACGDSGWGFAGPCATHWLFLNELLTHKHSPKFRKSAAANTYLHVASSAHSEACCGVGQAVLCMCLCPNCGSTMQLQRAWPTEQHAQADEEEHVAP